MVIRQECQHYEDCNAPLCPRDEEHSRAAIWYADEEVCRRRVKQPGWVRAQRKIQRKTRDQDRGYFSYTMLSTNPIVYAGIRGVNPDSQNRALAEASWVGKRSGADRTRPALTPAELIRRSAKMKASLASRSASPDDPGRSGHVEGAHPGDGPPEHVLDPETRGPSQVPFSAEKRQQEE